MSTDFRYPVYLRYSDEDEAWIAEVPDLPGCMADGETREDAIRAVEETAALWMDVAAEDGRDVPEPSDPGEASGKFLLRLPKSLHRRLQLMAQRESVSLNQLVLSLLSAREAGRRDA